MKAPNDQIKFVAEMGILKTIPKFLAEPLKPGRLKAAFVEVDHLVTKGLQNIYKYDPNFFPDNKDALAYYLNEFGKKANWVENETHVATVVSFCLAFLETSKYNYPDELFTNLNKIIDYYERAGNITEEDLISAEGFQNVWESIEDYPTILN